MTTQADDAMLTAYALDELNEAGRAEVEARIAADSSARQAVEDARRVAGILGDELAAEPAPQLTAAQRAAVET
ncbi:MAG: transcriptional regulator, partial [Phycisphaerae bacterium]